MKCKPWPQIKWNKRILFSFTKKYRKKLGTIQITKGGTYPQLTPNTTTNFLLRFKFEFFFRETILVSFWTVYKNFQLTLPGPGWGRLVICCALNSKLLEFFNCDLNLNLKNILFPISFNTFEKIDSEWQKPKLGSDRVKSHYYLVPIPSTALVKY